MTLNLIVTNNPAVAKLPEVVVSYHDETLMQILCRVRDLVHRHHQLITHPLAGSIKPNATPYKSIIVTAKPQEELDFMSLRLIEGAIQVAEGMLADKALRAMDEEMKADFALIDLELIKSALE